MQEDNIKRLIEILEKEYRLYQSLRELSKFKKEYIIEENLDSLKEIIKKEEKISGEIIELEKKRESIAGENKISELIDLVDDIYANKLEELQQKIIVLLEEIRTINQLNGDLINNSLQLTNMTINLLTNKQRQGTYGKKGMVDGNKRNSFINHKA